MRYLVTANQQLFQGENDNYKVVSVKDALQILTPMREVGLDTETEGFDPYTDALRTLQLGNFEDQVMIDCMTMDISLFKEYLESDRLFLLWNAKFDLKFLYHKRILVKNVWDGYLAEKIIWLGYPSGYHGLSLKDAASNYLGIELDKTVRGKIRYAGIEDDIVIYGCNDVKYLGEIKKLQEINLAKEDLNNAVVIENEFVKTLAYIEYCGVKLDVVKWKAKMIKDEALLRNSKAALDKWLINYCLSNPQIRVSPVNTIHITLWTYDNGDSFTIDSERAVIKKRKGARRIPSKDINTEYIRTEAWALPNKNPWITTQIQGDLFQPTEKIQCRINWSSSRQVIPVLEQLGFDLYTKDKDTGEMKKSVEATIIEPQKHKSEIAPLYLDFKAAEKIVSTYGQNFIDQINKVSHRIHTQFSQLMDTTRLSSGGKNKATKEEYVNLQNIPHDPETRSCFVASEGYKWISIDYSGQESVIIAEISKDPRMVYEFLHGSGDIHALVAKAAYPDIIGDTPVCDIKKLFKELRNDVKSQVEFPINYAGDANTIHAHSGKPIEECERIYNNYMDTFKGIATYQASCRKDVMQKGYILISEYTKHRAHIFDFDRLIKVKSRFSSEYWNRYRVLKGQEKPLPKPVLNQLYDRFANNEDFDSLTGTYTYSVERNKVITTKSVDVTIADVYVHPVKYYFKRKSASEKQSVNYRIQGRGAQIFKFASIKFFNWLIKEDLLFKVFYTIPVHDEINVEAPEEIVDKVRDNLMDCMVKAGKIFCKIVPLKAEAEVGDCWIH